MGKNKNNKSNKSNKSNRSNSNMSNEDFDKILADFAQSNLNDQTNLSNQTKSPLEAGLEVKNKEMIRKKLKDAINMKSQLRSLPSRKDIAEQTTELKKMMKHPKMTQEILKLYGEAIAYDPKTVIPKPLDIFADVEKHRALYYQYILNIIKEMKENNTHIIHLGMLLENPYARYMSKCIGCPLNPFEKNKKSNEVVSEEQMKKELEAQANQTNQTNQADQTNDSDDEIPELVADEEPDTQLESNVAKSIAEIELSNADDKLVSSA